MIENEFYALAKGDCFERDGKEYIVVKSEGKFQIAHPKGQPNRPLHFTSQRADQMKRVESKPETPRLLSSHGFPLLQKSPPKLPTTYTPEPGISLLCMALDGFLTEPRKGNEIGAPVPDAIDFLISAHHVGYQLQICTDRPQKILWDWLRIHCPGLESVIHVSPALPPPGTPYLSRYAWTLEKAMQMLEESSKEENDEQTAIAGNSRR